LAALAPCADSWQSSGLQTRKSLGVPSAYCRLERRTTLTLQAQSDLHGPGFAELIGSPQLASSLHKLGVFAPNIMQAEALAPATSGRDVLTVAQTGSGKTLTFVLPILMQDAKQQRQCRRKRPRDVFDGVAGPCRQREVVSLVLAPSAILADQHAAIAKVLAPANTVFFSTPDSFMADRNAGRISTSNLRIVAIDEVDAVLCGSAFNTSLPPAAVELLAALRAESKPQFLLTTAHLRYVSLFKCCPQCISLGFASIVCPDISDLGTTLGALVMFISPIAT